MTSLDVLGFYGTISELCAFQVRMDGGWGVDAPLGRQIRRHKGLDCGSGSHSGQPRDNLQRKLATGNGRETVSTSRILEKLSRFVQRREELLQDGAVFDGRDEGRFFVTLGLNPEKAFR